MHKYKMSRRPLILIYIILFLQIVLIKYIAKFVSRYIPFSVDKFILPVWIAAIVVALFIMPVFFVGAYATVSDKEITLNRTFIFKVKTFMPVESVKSVTAILLPLGRFVGLNFITINAMGARLIIPFLARQDAMEIYAIVNSAIRRREREKIPGNRNGGEGK